MPYDINPNNPLPGQFASFADNLRAVARKQCTSVWAYGPSGIGKTTYAERILAAAATAPVVTLGATTPSGLYLALYQNPDGTFLADDIEHIVLTRDDDNVSLMKQVLHPKSPRTVARTTRATVPPAEFQISAGFVIITNTNPFDPIIQKKFGANLTALLDRIDHVNQFSYDPSHVAEYILSIAVNDRLLLTNPGVSIAVANEALAFFRQNIARLRTISMRRLITIAQTIKTNPSSWQQKCNDSLLPLENARKDIITPAEAVLEPEITTVRQRHYPPHAPGASRRRRERVRLRGAEYARLLTEGWSAEQIATRDNITTRRVLSVIDIFKNAKAEPTGDPIAAAMENMKSAAAVRVNLSYDPPATRALAEGDGGLHDEPPPPPAAMAPVRADTDADFIGVDAVDCTEVQRLVALIKSDDLCDAIEAHNKLVAMKGTPAELCAAAGVEYPGDPLPRALEHARALCHAGNKDWIGDVFLIRMALFGRNIPPIESFIAQHWPDLVETYAQQIAYPKES